MSKNRFASGGCGESNRTGRAPWRCAALNTGTGVPDAPTTRAARAGCLTRSWQGGSGMLGHRLQCLDPVDVGRVGRAVPRRVQQPVPVEVAVVAWFAVAVVQ